MNTTLTFGLAASAALALSGCMTMNDNSGGDMAGMNHDGMKHDGMNHMMGAMLTGAAEVPGPGDMDGSGEFEYKLDMNASKLCYELEVDDIAAPTAAHIHEGAAGVAGGPVVTLETPMLGKDTEACVNLAPALARRIMATPANFYVNVHNAAYPAGAVRGQLTMMMHDM